MSLNIEIIEGKRGFYLLINGVELGDYYRSIGISCAGGRVYFQTRDLAEKQIEAEHNPRVN